MTIKFVLLVNKQGQTRLAKYTDSSLTTDERRALEAEIVRKCLTRVDKQVRFGEQGGLCLWLLRCSACKAAAQLQGSTQSSSTAARQQCAAVSAAAAAGCTAAPQNSSRALHRLPLQCNFVEHRSWKVVYRRYASLFFLVGIDDEEVRRRGEGRQWAGLLGSERFKHLAPGKQRGWQRQGTQLHLTCDGASVLSPLLPAVP